MTEEVLAINVEDWLIPHLKKRMNAKYIQKFTHADFDLFDPDKPVILGFEHIGDFSELGSLSDVLHLAAKLNLIKHVVYLSSYGIYSPKSEPYFEKDLISPMNFVGTRALALESNLFYLSRRYNLNLTILRLFNLYGPFQMSPYIIPTVLERIVTNGIVNIGDSEKVRDFLYVSDFLELIHLLLKQRESGIKVYNVGSGIGTSIHNLIKVSEDLTGSNCEVLFDALKLRKEYDYDYAVANISKIKKELNWSPKVDLKTGLSLTYQWILGRSGEHV